MQTIYLGCIQPASVSKAAYKWGTAVHIRKSQHWETEAGGPGLECYPNAAQQIQGQPGLQEPCQK